MMKRDRAENIDHAVAGNDLMCLKISRDTDNRKHRYNVYI